MEWLKRATYDNIYNLQSISLIVSLLIVFLYFQPIRFAWRGISRVNQAMTGVTRSISAIRFRVFLLSPPQSMDSVSTLIRLSEEDMFMSMLVGQKSQSHQPWYGWIQRILTKLMWAGWHVCEIISEPSLLLFSDCNIWTKTLYVWVDINFCIFLLNKIVSLNFRSRYRYVICNHQETLALIH